MRRRWGNSRFTDDSKCCEQLETDTDDPTLARNSAIQELVEYYLSDGNLQRDSYFCDLIALDAQGWIDVDPHILNCPRMQRLKVSCQELADALLDSHALEVDCAFGSSSGRGCRIRRKQPFQQCGSCKGAGKDRVKGNSKGKNDRRQAGPVYDPSTPCGYFMAGYCRHGDKCVKQHSVPYALAIRHEWLHAGDPQARASLQSAAEQVLGADGVASERLFPRAFSQRVETRSTAALVAACEPEETGFSWEGIGPQKEERSASAQKLRYLLVLDLEGKDEITEFPVMAIDAVSKREVGRFQRYVRPVHLFDGYTLQNSSPAIAFTAVLREFDDWLQSTLGRSLHALGQHDSDTAFVTCGDWDCKHVHTQCRISGIAAPRAFGQWVNIKRVYSDTYGGEFRGMKSMLSRLRLLDSKGDPKFGFHHLGMHDVENIGRCLLHLLEQNVEFAINGQK